MCAFKTTKELFSQTSIVPGMLVIEPYTRALSRVQALTSHLHFLPDDGQVDLDLECKAERSVLIEFT